MRILLADRNTGRTAQAFLTDLCDVSRPLYDLCYKVETYTGCKQRMRNQKLLRHTQKKAMVWAQNAATGDDLLHAKKHSEPLTILSVGRLVGFKGFRLALMAFASHLKTYPSSTLTLLGEGRQRNELEELSIELGIKSNVVFAGQVTRSFVLDSMGNSHVFLFPSFEGAGMVVIEAMAKGLPVVCLDFGGPGEYVTDECGIKVPLTEPEDVIQGLADALSRLASEPELYERLSAGAIERVRNHYLWDHVGERLNSLYRQLLDEASGR